MFGRYTPWCAQASLEGGLTCFLVLFNNKGPVSKGQDERPHNQVAHPPAETSTKVPPPRANDTTEGQAEAKKNKRERKEAKKELKLANHRESSKSHKPKRRKAGQETEQAAGGADAKASAAGKRSRGKDGDGAHGRDTAGEGVQTSPGRRKRKLSEGVWRAYARGFVKIINAMNLGHVESISRCISHQVKAEGLPVSSPDLEKPRGAGLLGE